MDESRGVSQEDIYHRLGSLEGKLDAAITKMTDFKRDLDTCYGRIRILEANLNKALGIAIILSIIIPLGLNVVTSDYHIHMTNKADQPDNR